MSATQAAHLAEQAIGHQDNAVTQQDVSDYKQTGDSGETMKALAWQGKNKVEIGMEHLSHSNSLLARQHQGHRLDLVY